MLPSILETLEIQNVLQMKMVKACNVFFLWKGKIFSFKIKIRILAKISLFLKWNQDEIICEMVRKLFTKWYIFFFAFFLLNHTKIEIDFSTKITYEIYFILIRKYWPKIDLICAAFFGTPFMCRISDPVSCIIDSYTNKNLRTSLKTWGRQCKLDKMRYLIRIVRSRADRELSFPNLMLIMKFGFRRYIWPS